MNNKTTEGGRQLRPWTRLGLALGLLLAGGLGWIRLQGTAPAPAPATTPPASAPMPTASTAGLPASAAPPPSTPAAASAARPGVPRAASAASAESRGRDGLSPERLAEIDRQWCTHGHAAHLQAQQVLDRTYPIHMQGSKLDHDALKARVDATLKEPGDQAIRARQTELKARWVALLRQRGDLRSQALADYLTTTLTAGPESIAAHQHLLGLAQSSRDPTVFMLWQLARTYCFGQSFCGTLPLSEWRSVEPQNLLAWMPERRNPGADVMDWAALQRTTVASTHLEEVLALLLPLLDQEAPGLSLRAGLDLVQQFGNLWPVVHNSLPLVTACLEIAGQPESKRKAACAHAAELLWRSPSSGLFEGQFALGMAAAAGLEEEAPWAGRTAFVKGLSAADEQALQNLEFRSRWDQQGCEAQPRQRQALKDLVSQGLWAAGLGESRWRGVP